MEDCDEDMEKHDPLLVECYGCCMDPECVFFSITAAQAAALGLSPGNYTYGSDEIRNARADAVSVPQGGPVGAGV